MPRDPLDITRNWLANVPWPSSGRPGTIAPGRARPLPLRTATAPAAGQAGTPCEARRGIRGGSNAEQRAAQRHDAGRWRGRMDRLVYRDPHPWESPRAVTIGAATQLEAKALS